MQVAVVLQGHIWLWCVSATHCISSLANSPVSRDSLHSIFIHVSLSSLQSCKCVMNFSEKELLLNLYANFIVQLVQILVLEPYTWWNKRACLPFQKSEVGDTDTEGVRTDCSEHIVSLEDKVLTTDLAHNRQLLLSQTYVIAICVR